VQVPFSDGVREIPDHVGQLMRDHGLRTYEMTYEQAQAQLDLANTRTIIDREADKIIGSHLKAYGR
jgi:hypothetical protein